MNNLSDLNKYCPKTLVNDIEKHISEHYPKEFFHGAWFEYIDRIVSCDIYVIWGIGYYEVENILFSFEDKEIEPTATEKKEIKNLVDKTRMFIDR